MRKTIIVAILAVFCSALCSAAFQGSDAGTSTAQFLKLGAGARAASLGNMFVGIADDATAVYWNPAGLGLLEGREVALMHSIWFDDIAYDWVSFTQKLKKCGTIGVGVQYLSYGDITETDINGVELSKFKPSDFAATLSYGKNLSAVSGLSVGANAKFISSKTKDSATAIAADLGALYKFMEGKSTLGFVLQNAGTGMKFIDKTETLPLGLKLGGSYLIKNNWLVTAGVDAYRDSAIRCGAGTEYSYEINKNFSIAARTGYNSTSSDTGGLHGLTAGAGVNYSGYSLDYSFVPFGDLGDTHKISAGAKF